MCEVEFEVRHFTEEQTSEPGWRISYKGFGQDFILGFSDEAILFDSEDDANKALFRMVCAGYKTAEDVEAMTDEVLEHILNGDVFDGEDIPLGSLVISHWGEYGHTLPNGKVHYFGRIPKYLTKILRKLGYLSIPDDPCLDELNETKVVIKVKSDEKEKIVL